ncbi:MAG: hypothetical protein ACI906_002937 [Candidatus Latescibacterota bacterium]
MREAVSLRDLYKEYGEQVQFIVVYIREAHPLDGWDLGSENRLRDPQTITERRRVAGQCEAAMQYDIGTYVDEMDDAVMTTYAAWPERLYLVDMQGHVAYAGGLGPWGFSPAKLKEAIDKIIA